MIIVEIAGHLGSDPEARFTPSGQKVTSLRVATNIVRGGKEKTVWWRVTCWGDRFDKRLQHLKKGSAVIVIGELGIPEIYTDKEGHPQISLELTAEILTFSPFGGNGKGDRANTRESSDDEKPYVPSQKIQEQRAQGPMPGNSQAQFADDDIPF